LLFSVLIRPEGIPPQCAGWIPLAAGLACAEAVTRAEPELRDVTVKWPNDIVLPCNAPPGWKKMGGVLCESALPALASGTVTSERDAGYAVIGIGLNINQTAEMLPEFARAPATSLLMECGKRVARKNVLREILERLEANLDLLERTEGRAELFE